ncbi:hypothetical protein L7A49_33190, partial [Achromobacter xylosoxidans]|nr:hypothetical protein [Achromobacter xylosoxidans]
GVIELVLPHGPLRPAKLMPACFITERDTSTTLTSTCTTPPVPVEQVSELLLAGRSGRLQLALRPVGDDGGPDTQLFAQRGAV